MDEDSARLERDLFELERFVRAQDGGDSYHNALRELGQGRKRSHWMWYVFPQLAGLGHSPMAQRYAIGSLAEAGAYLAHPTLGPRLIEISTVLLQLPGGSAEQIFGGIDAIKLRSSMTLFHRADPDQASFQAVLDRYFDGQPDPATDALL
jgi:uncharacterized protein (DUF1810 family)